MASSVKVSKSELHPENVVTTTTSYKTDSKGQTTIVTSQEHEAAMSRERESERSRRRVVNNTFRLARGIQRIHRIVDSSARDDDDGESEYDDDRSADSDSDSDRYSDSERDNDDDLRQSHAAEDDKDVGSIHDDDEPINDANHNEGAEFRNDISSMGLQHAGAFATGTISRGRAREVEIPAVKLSPEKPTIAEPAKEAASATTTAVTPKASKPDPLAPTAKAPYGYKIVKVRKPDGSVVQVKRPLKAEEATQTLSPPVAPAGGLPVPTQEQEKIQPAPLGTSPTIPSTRTAASDDLKKERQVEVSEKEIISDEKSGRTNTRVSKAAISARRVSRSLQIASWIIMVSFPLLFLGLGISAAALDHRPTGPSARLVQAKDIAISLWPIVFAAVLAQTLKAYAAYKVERGIKLVTLEQLMSSPSFAGAIKQPFILRTFNWTTIFLFLIWGLSPLAGQALVRMVYTEQIDIPQSQNVQYFQPQSMLSNATEFAYQNGADLTDVTEINAMYTGLLIGSVASRAASQDFWTNLKIPLYNQSGEDTAASFSSLLGIPVSITSASDTKSSQPELDRTFTITTTYFRLNCTDMISVNTSDPTVANLNLTASVSTTLLLSAENNTQFTFNTPAMFSHPASTFSYQAPGPEGIIHFAVNDPNYYGRRANGNSYFAYSPMLLYSQCVYDQIMVDNTVDCSGEGSSADCQVTDQALRTPSAGDLAPLGYSFIEAMLKVGGSPSNGTQLPTETEQYIYNPSFAALSSSKSSLPSGGDGFVGMKGTQISQNFGQLVNTLWLAGTKHKLFLGGDLNALHQDQPNGWAVSNSMATVHGNTVTSYVTQWAWCVILIVCSVVLLVVAVAAAIFESLTVGPDFLGFANTSIRRGVKLPRGMNQLSASDRLDAMRECEILLQDVRPEDAEMGKVALGVREENSVRLIAGRKYR